MQATVLHKDDFLHFDHGAPPTATANGVGLSQDLSWWSRVEIQQKTTLWKKKWQKIEKGLEVKVRTQKWGQRHHARSSVTGTLEWKHGIIRKQTTKSLASVLAPWSWNESVESSTSRATNPMSSDSGAYLQLERNTDDTSLHACLLEGTKDTWSSMRCNFVRMLERR
jgi:hypothetical protein